MKALTDWLRAHSGVVGKKEAIVEWSEHRILGYNPFLGMLLGLVCGAQTLEEALVHLDEARCALTDEDTEILRSWLVVGGVAPNIAGGNPD